LRTVGLASILLAFLRKPQSFSLSFSCFSLEAR
jgi:hypothetical protein